MCSHISSPQASLESSHSYHPNSINMNIFNLLVHFMTDFDTCEYQAMSKPADIQISSAVFKNSSG